MVPAAGSPVIDIGNDSAAPPDQFGIGGGGGSHEVYGADGTNTIDSADGQVGQVSGKAGTDTCTRHTAATTGGERAADRAVLPPIAVSGLSAQTVQ